MQPKKCVRCNTLNSPEQVYCVKCGKFLSKQTDSAKTIPTIWDLGGPKQKQDSKAFSVKNGADEYVVVCPQCNSVISVEDGIMPLACGQCGYFFQDGIDKIVLKDTAKKRIVQPVKSTQDTTYTADGRNDQSGQKKGPLPRRSNDATKLRLILITQSGIMPQTVREAGEILGKGGTVLKRLITNQQMSILHTPAGWYVRTLAGHPLYNGVPLNEGQQTKLSDGDILTIEREQIRVEIV